MANIFDNQINIEGQLIKTLDKYKGVYGSLSFSPMGYFSGWIDYIYYDTGLDLNDMGYLWRDDYSKIKAIHTTDDIVTIICPIHKEFKQEIKESRNLIPDQFHNSSKFPIEIVLLLY